MHEKWKFVTWKSDKNAKYENKKLRHNSNTEKCRSDALVFIITFRYFTAMSIEHDNSFQLV